MLIERTATGGQAGQSSRIENYLGFPDGVSGGQLADRARRQAEKFGAELITARKATALEVNGPERTVRFADGGSIDAHAVILATGVSYRQLTAEGCTELTGCGVYYGAAMSIAADCEGEEVYVIGGANSAGQAAMYLSRTAKSVNIAVRAPSLEDVDVVLPHPADRGEPEDQRPDLHRGAARHRRGPPGDADPGQQPDRRRRGRQPAAGCSSSSGPRRAPTGSTGCWPATTTASSSPGRTCATCVAGPLDRPPHPPRNQRSGRVRDRRRAFDIGQTGRGRGR